LQTSTDDRAPPASGADDRDDGCAAAVRGTATRMIRSGSTVHWTWGRSTASGTVEERFERTVRRTIKGASIVKHGSADNPAYLIRQDDGDRVLKLRSELHER
jgi:hypothetical protein